MDKKDLRLIIFLGIFSIIIIFIGFLQIRGVIYAPFNFSANRDNKEITEEELQEEAKRELSQRDTDNDGLSDFDEKFVYQTSIYLFDSDGDSFSDKEEVDAGSDPLNPESTPYREPKPEEDENVLDEEGLINEEDEISSEEIRNLLINQGGIDKEIVDNLDDKTLIKLYNETKQETGINLEDLGILDKEDISQFSNLSASEMREMLINEGVDEEMLEKIDDQTLMQLIQESLSGF